MDTIDRHHLPLDVPTLHAIIGDLLDMIEEQKQVIARQQKIIEEQAQQIEQLTDRVAHLEKRLYGPRTERKSRSSAQAGAQRQKNRHKHGRRPLPKDLPRSQKNYDLQAHERICSECGAFLSKIDDVISEQLDCIPSQLYVIQHRRAKYACKKCQSKVVVAPMPLQAIDKGLAGCGLIADVMVSKYQEHMPLYRQSQRFKRLGIDLNRSTLCGWVMMGAELLKPLVERLKQHLLAGNHLFSDDTSMKVLQGVEGQSKTGRFWIYTSKSSDNKPGCCVYEFTPDRKGHHPREFLKDFEGYLQADAYTGYEKLYQGAPDQLTRIVEVACWAHCRRYFVESAQGTAPDSLANQGLAFITALYKIESKARDLKLQGKALQQWRQERAPPLLNQFWQWLQTHQPPVLPKSRLAQAMNYAMNHWQALNNYLKEDYLEIDNNRAERAMRPIALGRKNYLFVGHFKAGQAAATIYSLIETCKHYNINSQHYLSDVLQRISTHPYSKIDELLPYHWKPLHQTNPYPLNGAHDNKIAA